MHPRWARARINCEPRARSRMPSAAAEGGASRKDAECCKLSMQPRAGEASCRLGSERRLRVYWLNSPVSAAERAAAKACRGESAERPQSLTTSLLLTLKLPSSLCPLSYVDHLSLPRPLFPSRG